MNKISMMGFAVLLVQVLTGCVTPKNMPLVFGQSHTVGISINGSATDQGAELTLGYKDRDIAIVPVTIQQADQNNIQLSATTTGDTDAFSVLGQFEVNSRAGQPEAGLGKFFATGIAARRLADGFASRMGEEQSGEEEEGNNPAEEPPVQ